MRDPDLFGTAEAPPVPDAAGNAEQEMPPSGEGRRKAVVHLGALRVGYGQGHRLPTDGRNLE